MRWLAVFALAWMTGCASATQGAADAKLVREVLEARLG